MSKKQRLPIMVRALDIEGVTMGVPTVLCPSRRDVMTVGTCRQCRGFRRLERDERGKAVLTCVPLEHVERAHLDVHACEVKDVLRVPMACAAPDTTLGSIQPYLELHQPEDVIPVLDWSARPIGLITIAGLQRLIRGGAELSCRLSSVMSVHFAVAAPSMSLADAARLPNDSEFRGVIVVDVDDTFLGLVPASELRRDIAEPVASMSFAAALSR